MNTDNTTKKAELELELAELDSSARMVMRAREETRFNMFRTITISDYDSLSPEDAKAALLELQADARRATDALLAVKEARFKVQGELANFDE